MHKARLGVSSSLFNLSAYFCRKKNKVKSPYEKTSPRHSRLCCDCIFQFDTGDCLAFVFYPRQPRFGRRKRNRADRRALVPKVAHWHWHDDSHRQYPALYFGLAFFGRIEICHADGARHPRLFAVHRLALENSAVYELLASFDQRPARRYFPQCVIRRDCRRHRLWIGLSRARHQRRLGYSRADSQSLARSFDDAKLSDGGYGRDSRGGLCLWMEASAVCDDHFIRQRACFRDRA